MIDRGAIARNRGTSVLDCSCHPIASKVVLLALLHSTHDINLPVSLALASCLSRVIHDQPFHLRIQVFARAYSQPDQSVHCEFSNSAE